MLMLVVVFFNNYNMFGCLKNVFIQSVGYVFLHSRQITGKKEKKIHFVLTTVCLRSNRILLILWDEC